MNIYVGNLPFSASESDIVALFERFGSVSRASIISDKFTGRSRGFAFVEMENENGEANQAIEGLNGADFSGRQLVVNEAREREDNGSSQRRRSNNNYR